MTCLPTKRLKYAVQLRRSRVEGADDERPYVGLEHIESQTGRLLSSAFAEPSEQGQTAAEDSLCNTFEAGDVLFGKLRPYLAKAWVAEFSGQCSTELLVFQPRAFDSRFLRSICLSMEFVGAVDASAFGSKMPRADWDFIGNLRVPVPPIAQQRAIADYLDRETGRIDRLIAVKERWLEILAEKRRAVIAHAVTRGIRPDVPVQETGVGWLGKIPQTWNVKRVKYLFRLITDAAPEGNEYELLALYTDIGVRPRKELEARGNRASTTDGYWTVRRGDLVVNKLLAWMGAFGVSAYDGVTSPAYDVLRPLPAIDSMYYHYLFRCGICFPEFRRRSTGIMDMRLRLYFDQFGDMPVPVPPVDEQRAIVTQIVAETRKLDSLRAATERTIALLKERRAALIAAVVTGRIAVPEPRHGEESTVGIQ